MNRTQIYIMVNDQRVFAGWSDEPIAATILAMSVENERLRAEVARLQTFLPPMDDSTVDL